MESIVKQCLNNDNPVVYSLDNRVVDIGLTNQGRLT